MSLLLAFAAPIARAAPASYDGISADGKVAFFSTTDKLVSGDTDGKLDVYMRSLDSDLDLYVTREVSTGPSGGNDAFDAFFEHVSSDGKKILFSTAERLVATDTDQATDIYLRDLAKGTELVSQGASACFPTCGNGAVDAGFADAGADGLAAFFFTEERLDNTDTDNAVDVYRRDLVAGTTVLVSAGGSCALPCGNDNAFDATLRGLSGNGSTAFFTTSEQLADADTDVAIDIYARHLPGGPTTLISGGSQAQPASFASTSTDGTVAFFETVEGLPGSGDVDGEIDVYRWTPGGTTLISGGEHAEPANFAAASSDGVTAFFFTADSLVGAGDTNGSNDVYMWQGGSPSLVTSGKCCDSTFRAASADGTTVVFSTAEKLDPANDTDGVADVYAQEIGGGVPTLVSRGSSSCVPPCGIGPATFKLLSADASKVFFASDEALDSEDVDADADVYVHDLDDSTTSLVSPEGVSCPTPGGCDAALRGASDDGGRVFFQTTERVTEGDVDSELDVYERAGTQLRLVTTGNSVELGPSTPVLTGTTPGSPGASTTPGIVGQADPDTAIKLYKTADCSGEVVATGTAAQLGGGGVTVTVVAGSTTSFRATATDGSGDTSACSNAVSYTQEDAPPPPPPPPGDEGSGGGGTGTGSGGGGTGGAKKGDGKPGVVYVTPRTRITFAPAGKTVVRRPVFQFTDSTGQEGTTFRCKVDRGRWRGCGSPVKLKALKLGRHVFQVKALNAAGEAEPAPQRRKFKVVSG